MEFDGIEKVRNQIRKNSQVLQLMQQMAAKLDYLLGGGENTMMVAQLYGTAAPTAQAPHGGAKTTTAAEENAAASGGIAGRRKQLEQKLDEVKRGNQ
jgi:hypothetical protein